MRGKVQTVLGLVDPDELGNTLTHEHLLHELNNEVFRTPLPALMQRENVGCFDIENLGCLRQYPYSFDENMEFAGMDVEHAVTQELKFLKTVGGGTIVENSSLGLRANNQSMYLKKLSIETGIKIVAGTGFYVEPSQPSDTLRYSSEDMERIISYDMKFGMQGTEVKCGVIGEIGCSFPLLPFEKRALVAAAKVQRSLRCPVIIHPGRSKDSPDEIMRVFLEAGGIARKTVMSHLDRTLVREEELAEFASIGCIYEFDLFGTEVSHYQLCEDVDMPSDAQRISRIKYLIKEGLEDRIVVSHDIHTKHKLMKFGGHGYSHILINVVPKMLKRGISQGVINKFLISNPKKWLAFG